MATMKVQNQIRQNAEEVSLYLSDLSKWEKTVNKRNTSNRTTSVPKALPVRLGSGTVKDIDKRSISKDIKNITAASHTYDVGYKKWDKFNVADALAEQEKEDNAVDVDNDDITPEINKNVPLITNLTPASLARRHATKATIQTAVPAARGTANTKDDERERGNLEYEGGNFTAAVKLYTKCLGMKGRNYKAFSNRAMAYLKLKEFNRAEIDCTSALAIDSTHVKSYTRRATGRNALGKHRAALDDLNTAVILETNVNRQVRGEIQRTKELLKSACNRAPLVSIPTIWLSDYNKRNDEKSSCSDSSSNNNDNKDGISSSNNDYVYQGPDLPDSREKIATKIEIIKIEEKETEKIHEIGENREKNEIQEINYITTNNTATIIVESEIIDQSKVAWEYIPKKRAKVSDYDGQPTSQSTNEPTLDHFDHDLETSLESSLDTSTIATIGTTTTTPASNGDSKTASTHTTPVNDSTENENEIPANKIKKKMMKMKMKKITPSKKPIKKEIINGYKLERELLLCNNNDKTLNLLMSSLIPSYACKMFNNNESDIIYNFVIALSKWIKNVHNAKNTESQDTGSNCDNEDKCTKNDNKSSNDNSNLLYDWLISISQISSFSILKLLLTIAQKQTLLELLYDNYNLINETLDLLDADAKTNANINASEIDYNIYIIKINNVRQLWQM